MRKAEHVLFFLVCALIVFLLARWFVGGPDSNISDDSTDTHDPVKNSPQYILNQHQEECWTSKQAPKAELPSAAIVQFNNGHTIYTKNHKLVEAAFNEALASIGFGNKTSDQITVIALCK